MGKRINKIGGIIVLVFLVSMVIIGYYKRHLLLNDFVITKGKVTEITLPVWKSYGDYSILFEYRVGNKAYSRNVNYNYCTGISMAKLRGLLVGKIFPVAYAQKDPSTGTLLVTQENAERFKFQLPDSVKYYDSVLTCKQ